jgi:hypothetical protein
MGVKGRSAGCEAQGSAKGPRSIRGLRVRETERVNVSEPSMLARHRVDLGMGLR